MKCNKLYFEKLSNPVIEIDGIASLKRYLATNIKEWNGYRIARFVFKRDIILCDIVISYKDVNSIIGITYHKAELKRVFFGYVEDVAYNVQRGYYIK